MHVTKKLLAGALAAITVANSAPARAQVDNEAVGTILGGIIGGLLGSQVGEGDGKTAATIAGAIIGAAVGNVLGESLDEQDRLAAARARARALESPGAPVRWDGRDYDSRTGANGNIVVLREGYYYSDTTIVCREYQSEVYVSGRYERTVGQACRDGYGNWQEVTTREVVFSRTYRGPYGSSTTTTRETTTTRRSGSGPVYGGGVYDGPVYGGGYEPVPTYPRGGYAPIPAGRPYVSSQEHQNLKSVLFQNGNDYYRVQLLQQYARNWSYRGVALKTVQARDYLAVFSNDHYRLEALRALRPVIEVRYEQVERVVALFYNAYYAQQARAMLLQ